jgi:hypothetical protein
MRRIFGVCVVLLLALGLFPGNLFGQSPSRDRGSQLRQNFPNPFNPDTKFAFDVFEEDLVGGRPAIVTLRIFNVLQQYVASPKAEHHPLGNVEVDNLPYDSPGLKEAFWDGTDRNGRKVASGIYYFQLIVNGERRGVKKMVVTK